jgi:hypothetical protein
VAASSPWASWRTSSHTNYSDSVDDGLPYIRKILAQSKQKEVIDLTVEEHSGDGDGDEDDVTKVNGLRNA